ncbi:MAG: methylenetetrahydrofolate reductase [Pseudorhodoplanes sp.]|jgi:methylenetetrahydrofolate reductase (NADPH)|nr:methylenetetrahydrofolate reductase [Pseudorhodoplanes sp.]
MSLSQQAADTHRLHETLKSKRFVVTAEITPPVSCDRNDLLAKALPLKGLADAVNVTDGAGARPHMDSVTAAAILIDNGIDPVLQLTCRDRNRIALQSALLAAATLGVRNLLALRGDNPDAGDQPDAKAVFDLDARTLLQTAARMRDQGELPSGRKIAGEADFFLGAADMPIDPPAEWKPAALTAKIAAGAQFAQTQFCMDAQILRRYMARLSDFGIPEKLFMLIGVVPLRSAKSARWIRQHLFGSIIPDAMVDRMEQAADPAREGKAILVEYLEEIATIPGVAGAHIMAPNHDDAVPEVITEIRRRSGW